MARRRATPPGPRTRNTGVVRVRIGDILNNPQNYRTHPRAQQQGLNATVREIGWFGYPDVFQHPDHPDKYMLVDGELRTEHLRKAYGDDAEIDVNLTDFDAAEAAKALLTKDQLAAMAGIEQDKLTALLAGITPEHEDFSTLLESLGPTEDANLDDDGPAPEPSRELSDKWQAERGSLWRIAGKAEHRVLCGDSTSAEDVARLLEGDEPFLMVTDPPYGVEYAPDWRHAANLNNSQRVGRVTSDDRVDWSAAYAHFPGRVAYVWHAGRYVAELMLSLAAAGLTPRATVIWRKPTIVIGRGHYHWQHEPLLVATRERSGLKWRGGDDQSTVWEISNRIQDSEHKSLHGTQKPLECMGRPIRNHGTADDAVYDPFLGTGTTIVAADRLGRPAYGLEIEPVYMAVILERASQEGCEIERIG